MWRTYDVAWRDCERLQIEIEGKRPNAESLIVFYRLYESAIYFELSKLEADAGSLLAHAQAIAVLGDRQLTVTQLDF